MAKHSVSYVDAFYTAIEKGWGGEADYFAAKETESMASFDNWISREMEEV